MADLIEKLRANLQRVRQRIEASARSSGRNPGQIALLAITKYVDAATAGALADLGCLRLGESRPQELWAKAEAMQDRPIEWHLVGHLQRNKVRRTLPLVALIHSVDSLRLLDAIDAAAAEQSRVTNALLEVNISGEAAKHGFAPDELPLAVEHAQRVKHVHVRGLMGMASLGGDRDVARAQFARLRELRDELRTHCSGEVELDELSIGMSHDFEMAIEEGATIVRVGTALFEGIEGIS